MATGCCVGLVLNYNYFILNILIKENFDPFSRVSDMNGAFSEG